MSAAKAKRPEPGRRDLLRAAGATAGLALSGAWPIRALAKSGGAPADERRPLPVFDIAAYGASGDGEGDCTKAIQSALDDAARAGGAVLIPSGQYAFADVLNVAGNVTMLGADGSLLVAKAERQALMLSGDNITLRGVAVRSGATQRRTNREAHAISAVRATRLVIENCAIEGANAAGIYINGCADFLLRDNLVEKTLADTIHITGASTRGIIAGNTCRSGGDDGIGVVSYVTQRGRCSDIAIVANNISRGRSRGVAIVGGENIRITANRIEDTRWAGIYIASEGSYDTYGARHIRVEGNHLNGTSPAAGGSTHACITVVARPGRSPSDQGAITNENRDLQFVANVVRGGGTSSFRVDAHARDVLAAANLFADTGGWGIDTSAYDARLIGNRISRTERGGISVGRACLGGTTEMIGNEIALGSSRTQPAVAVHRSELGAAIIRSNRIRYDSDAANAFRLSGSQRVERAHNAVNDEIVD